MKNQKELKEYQFDEIVQIQKGKIYDDVERYYFDEKERLALRRNIELHCKNDNTMERIESMYAIEHDNILTKLRTAINNIKNSWVRSRAA